MDDSDPDVTTPEPKHGMLPHSVVFTVQIISSIWKLMIIALVGLPWQLMIWLYILIDFAYDSLVRLFIGNICVPCAWVFILLFKLPSLVIILPGMVFRVVIAFMGALVDGWMLFFGGSGCFLRWGYDCQFAKRFKDKSYWQILDLPIWLRDPTRVLNDPTVTLSDSLLSLIGIPRLEDFNTKKALGETCPLKSSNSNNWQAFYN